MSLSEALAGSRTVTRPRKERKTTGTMILRRTGAACSSGKAGPSSVLEAMGYLPSAMNRTIRLSASAGTSTGDWSDLVKAVRVVFKQLESEEATQSLTTAIDL